MTPRQMSAWLFLAGQRHKRERHEKLGIEALAASGDGRAITEQQRKFEAEIDA